MSDHLENWLLHSVHETFGDGPPGEVFAEYERLRASAELSENRADVYEECVKKLASAEAADRECLSSLWKMTDRCNDWRDRYIKLERVVVNYIRSPEGCGQEEYKALEAAVSMGDEHE